MATASLRPIGGDGALAMVWSRTGGMMVIVRVAVVMYCRVRLVYVRVVAWRVVACCVVLRVVLCVRMCLLRCVLFCVVM